MSLKEKYEEAGQPLSYESYKRELLKQLWYGLNIPSSVFAGPASRIEPLRMGAVFQGTGGTITFGGQTMPLHSVTVQPPSGPAPRAAVIDLRELPNKSSFSAEGRRLADGCTAVSVQLTPEDAIERCLKSLDIERPYEIDLRPGAARGQWVVDVRVADAIARAAVLSTCSDCKGSGKYVGLAETSDCSTCGGSGRAKVGDVDELRIQPGASIDFGLVKLGDGLEFYHPAD